MSNLFVFTYNSIEYFIGYIDLTVSEFFVVVNSSKMIANNITLSAGESGPITFGGNIYDNLPGNFVQYGNDIYYLGYTTNIDPNTGFNVNIYKLSPPFTQSVLWVEETSTLNWDYITIMNNSIIAISVGSFDDNIPPAICEIDPNTANTYTIKNILPNRSITDTFGTYEPYYLPQFFSEGIVLLYDATKAGYSGISFLSYDGTTNVGLIAANANCNPGTICPGPRGLSVSVNDVIEVRKGVLFFYADFTYGTVPYIAVPCGDGIIQYPETCDDINDAACLARNCTSDDVSIGRQFEIDYSLTAIFAIIITFYSLRD